jgi:hypothetical protein
MLLRTIKKDRYNPVTSRRRTQVAREQSAKLRCGGSNPPGASITTPFFGFSRIHFPAAFCGKDDIYGKAVDKSCLN